VSELSDAAAADLIRQDQIDILVDFGGHSGGNRLLIFALKPAPIQIGHFGYQGSTGLATMDYRITDAYSDPPGMTERYHTEQLLRLPEQLWCYPPPKSPEVGPLPALRVGHVTFGSFNNPTKINQQVLATWARILSQVSDARLAVQCGVGRETEERLLDAFALEGVSARRVTLLPKTRREAYFQLYRDIDICLDTFPYTGCNTTADALWMGVPLVSLAGTTCFQRQAVGPLTSVGLGDLVVSTTDTYVETAVSLARDIKRLSELRGSLRERMRQSPLTNVPRFTRQLEQAYRSVWRIYVAKGETLVR
jgi:predicted O-linked N-acetylglucosamine transferase (SPINDLY family)